MKNFENLEGDLREIGISKFLIKHQCNDVCKALGLKNDYFKENQNEKWIEIVDVDHKKD
jgi:hypothetical protein